MIAMFRYTLARARGAILGWGIGLGIFGAYMVSFWDTFKDMGEQLNELLAAYPKQLVAFFGDLTQIATPEGFINIEFFTWMPLVLGIYALQAGAGLIVRDEENGTLDLELAHPISRSQLFFGRLFSLITSLFLIMLIVWLGFMFAMTWSTMDIKAEVMARAFLSLFAVLLVFGTFALLMSLVLPARRMASMFSGLFLVASFLLTSLARLDENLEPIAKLFPLAYYQGGEALVEMNWEWFWGLMATSLIFILVAWWRFRRRDIRVGGEGRWEFPFFSRKRARRRGL